MPQVVGPFQRLPPLLFPRRSPNEYPGALRDFIPRKSGHCLLERKSRPKQELGISVLPCPLFPGALPDKANSRSEYPTLAFGMMLTFPDPASVIEQSLPQ